MLNAVILLSLCYLLLFILVIASLVQIKSLRETVNRLQAVQNHHSEEISALIRHGQNVAVGLNDVIASLNNRDRYILSQTMLNSAIIGEA